MRPFVLTAAYVAAGLSLIALALWTFVVVVYPRVGPAPTFTVDPTEARLERGRYLVEHVTQCFGCHGTPSTAQPGASVDARTRGGAGRSWEPGGSDASGASSLAPNITPAAVGTWTDGELARATFLGVTPDARVLRPSMPYPHYAFMCLEDRLSIIAYLRTLAPIEAQPRATPPSYVESLLLRMIPREDPIPACDGDDTSLARGTYLATIAACGGCHTPLRNGVPDLTRAFAGGRRWDTANGPVRSANLTPHADGLAAWTREDFVAAFRSHAAPPPVDDGDGAGPMPWAGYAGLTDADLAAVFVYLQSLPPVPSE